MLNRIYKTLIIQVYNCNAINLNILQCHEINSEFTRTSRVFFKLLWNLFSKKKKR
jgi:hypothetical protein